MIPVSGSAADVLIELAKPTGSYLTGYNRESVYTGNLGDYLDKSITYITPEMFGAKGDGVADDRISIQSAIDFASLVYAQTGTSADVYLSKIILCRSTPHLPLSRVKWRPDEERYALRRVYIFVVMGR